MTYFHTCKTCQIGKAPCEMRAKLEAAIAGLGVGSLKHKCPTYQPMFVPGAPVAVLTVAWMGHQHPEDDREPPKHWYPGHFIRYSRTSLIVFVKAGATPTDDPDGDAFEPNGSGFIKAPFYRVKPSDWAAPVCVDQCDNCGAITALGQPCGRDAPYHPLARCQAHRSAALAEAAEMLDGPPSEPAPIEADEDEWVF